MKTCKKCLNAYRRSDVGIHEEINKGAYGKGKWPKFIYHNNEGRLCDKHRSKANYDGSKRRAKKLNATPSWANLTEIKKIYEDAIALEKKTGKKYHVDHEIPLQGKLVCGLHVENNLKILLASKNVRKSNRFIPS